MYGDAQRERKSENDKKYNFINAPTIFRVFSSDDMLTIMHFSDHTI